MLTFQKRFYNTGRVLSKTAVKRSIHSRLSLRARDWGFPLAAMSMTPSYMYFIELNKTKYNPKDFLFVQFNFPPSVYIQPVWLSTWNLSDSPDIVSRTFFFSVKVMFYTIVYCFCHAFTLLYFFQVNHGSILKPKSTENTNGGSLSS